MMLKSLYLFGFWDCFQYDCNQYDFWDCFQVFQEEGMDEVVDEAGLRMAWCLLGTGDGHMKIHF